jgi:hypothetical protein
VDKAKQLLLKWRLRRQKSFSTPEVIAIEVTKSTKNRETPMAQCGKDTNSLKGMQRRDSVARPTYWKGLSGAGQQSGGGLEKPRGIDWTVQEGSRESLFWPIYQHRRRRLSE